MTLKDQIVSDSNTLRAQYLENSWRCYGTVANYYSLPWGSHLRSAILETAWLLVTNAMLCIA